MTPEGGMSSQQSDNSIFMDVVGGVNKKGRIYGLGSEAGKYKASTSRSFDGIFHSEYEQMKSLVSSLTVENKTLHERLETHEDRFRSNEELIRSSQEESHILREQLYNFMQNFSLSRPFPLPSHADPLPPPPQPPSTDQDNQQEDEYGLDNEFEAD